MNSGSQLRITFLIMAAVLAASLAITYLAGQEAIQRSEEVSARRATIQEIQETFSSIQDAETGQRGFLLTGLPEYLAPYTNSLDDLPPRLRHLQNAARKGEIPAPLADRFLKLTADKSLELAHSIELERKQGAPSAVAFVQSGAGLKNMDDIRAVLRDIVAYEDQHLQDAEETSRNLNNLRGSIFVSAVLINLGFLIWAYRRIRREMARRYVADLETERQREILAVSLASIGDAVIITDTDARITFVNEIAEELSGWLRAEAIGKPCAKVFNIINETTRQPVESPVELVLRSGKIVGLANHTLLIRKDGTELPIDDSGAPVRENDGTIRGVILVFRDFTQYKKSAHEMQEIQKRLEIANQSKDDFLAALSHELRTPLTPVLAALSGWQSDPALPAELSSDVQMLIRNVRLEVRLIDDLLDLTRISRGQITLHRERVDSHALLAAVAEIFRAEVDARQIRLGVRTGATRFFVEGDPARLQQVYWNILSNAVKHTPAGGRIEIVTSNIEDDLRVTIADNGRGMSAEMLKHLFKPFERRAIDRDYQPRGLGIGLTISQNLIEAHGGSITAESSGPDLGATFTVRMPALPDLPTAAMKSASGAGQSESSIRLDILLVEDHEDSATVISRIVRNMGHSVEVSHTVSDALEQLRAKKFQLVLSDIGLPDGTGIELLARSRDFTDTPMIALTGYGMEDDLAKYREAGFLHQLTKPVRFDQLEKLLRDFAASQSQTRGLKVRS